MLALTNEVKNREGSTDLTREVGRLASEGWLALQTTGGKRDVEFSRASNPLGPSGRTEEPVLYTFPDDQAGTVDSIFHARFAEPKDLANLTLRKLFHIL